MAADSTQPRRGSPTWYRDEQARFKSVKRRANPVHRRLARGVVALALLAAAGVGIFFGAREVRDYLDRDKLPPAGAEVPDFQVTSFQVRSSAPGPVVDGTITLDTTSGAFEFVGSVNGPQSGIQVVSPDGQTAYIRTSGGDWRAPTTFEPIVPELKRAIPYLIEFDTADDLLINRMRQGFVELVDQATEGAEDDELTRYEMSIDSVAFSEAYPLQWSSFLKDAIPGAVVDRDMTVTMWINGDDVVVRLRDDLTNWSWERLTYEAEPFRPFDPGATLLEGTTEPSDGTGDGG